MKSVNLGLENHSIKDINFSGCLLEKLKTLLLLLSPSVLAAPYCSEDIIFQGRKR